MFNWFKSPPTPPQVKLDDLTALRAGIMAEIAMLKAEMKALEKIVAQDELFVKTLTDKYLKRLPKDKSETPEETTENSLKFNPYAL